MDFFVRAMNPGRPCSLLLLLLSKAVSALWISDEYPAAPCCSFAWRLISPPCEAPTAAVELLIGVTPVGPTVSGIAFSVADAGARCCSCCLSCSAVVVLLVGLDSGTVSGLAAAAEVPAEGSTAAAACSTPCSLLGPVLLVPFLLGVLAEAVAPAASGRACIGIAGVPDGVCTSLVLPVAVSAAADLSVLPEAVAVAGVLVPRGLLTEPCCCCCLWVVVSSGGSGASTVSSGVGWYRTWWLRGVRGTASAPAIRPWP
jgi:hypothetical protein